MSIHVNVGGQNKKTSNAWMKINGEWKKGTFWNNVNGEWKKHSNGGVKLFGTLGWQSYSPCTTTLYTKGIGDTTVSQVDLTSTLTTVTGIRKEMIANPYASSFMFTSNSGVSRTNEVNYIGTLLRSTTATSSDLYKTGGGVLKCVLDKDKVLAHFYSASTGTFILFIKDINTGEFLASYKMSKGRLTSWLSNVVYNKERSQIAFVFADQRTVTVDGETIDEDWLYFGINDSNTLNPIQTIGSTPFAKVGQGCHVNVVQTSYGYVVFIGRIQTAYKFGFDGSAQGPITIPVAACDWVLAPNGYWYGAIGNSTTRTELTIYQCDSNFTLTNTTKITCPYSSTYVYRGGTMVSNDLYLVQYYNSYVLFNVNTLQVVDTYYDNPELLNAKGSVYGGWVNNNGQYQANADIF